MDALLVLIALIAIGFVIFQMRTLRWLLGRAFSALKSSLRRKRKMYHERRHRSKVVVTVMRDVRATRTKGREFEFYFRRGWMCVRCGAVWPL